MRGARQVGKTSFVLNALKELEEFPQIRVNLASNRKTTIDGVEYFGRDFFGAGEDAGQFINNIGLLVGNLSKLSKPVVVFIDEADRHPASLEAIQIVAGLSDRLKVVYTGSNLENIMVKNAATGRKQFFDLYPVTFFDFLKAYSKDDVLAYWSGVSLNDKGHSEMFHNELNGLFDLYLRLGGMPKILDSFIDRRPGMQQISGIISNLVETIEDNIKMVLGEKAKLYEYEDVLRRIAILSTETLKFSKLQVRHVNRGEAKKIVNKTAGGRVVHKVRLYESGVDLSKYILFDVGVLNYLLNGSDLVHQQITETHLACQYETVVGTEIISSLPTRDDIYYWKSQRGSQVEFMLKSPALIAIDVKTTRGDTRSLDSCAVFEKDVDYLVKSSREPGRFDVEHTARIPALGLSRKVPLVVVPHYLSSRLLELIGELHASGRSA